MTKGLATPAAAAVEEQAVGRVDRRDFPILARRIHGRPLVYLDNAATTQKPRQVLDAMRMAYETSYANVHRGAHTLGYEATEAYEAARRRVARFINAQSAGEVVFTRGATEAINQVALALGRARLTAGDEIVVTELEHHSNIVPWQMLCEERGCVLRVAPIDDAGDLTVGSVADVLSARTRIVAVTHVSNVLGTVTPVAEIAALAHRSGAVVLIDGCQAVPHRAVDVQAIDADFYAFSGHKMYGPTGIGVLYGKQELLEELPPVYGGGEMVASVSFKRATFKPPPYRFEAGTPPIVEAIGLGAAVDYISGLSQSSMQGGEREVLDYALRRLAQLPDLRILGAPRDRVGVISFVMEGVHPHDIATVLDRTTGVAIRAGHHCAEPLMARLGVPSTARASFGLYNTAQDVDALVQGLQAVRELFC